ncbi:MAG TPA: ATP-binding protein [Bacteroidales bacterium]|nr:ATP-binding protein [Bacteroidales bacterium]
MTEISLNILDIVQNSISACADEIRIEVSEDSALNVMDIIVSDNGRGIQASVLPTVDDPFTTTRTTRRTGFGLPLLKHHTELTGGNLNIESSVKGTVVKARFGLDHIDRQPVGDIAGVLIILISANPDIELLYSHKTNRGTYNFSTVEIKNVLEMDKLNDHTLLEAMREMIRTNLENISASVS